jgi:hypothetical protein
MAYKVQCCDIGSTGELFYTRWHPRPSPYTLVQLMRLAHVTAGWLDAGHHLFLGNEMINPLKQAKQVLHVTAPLVQNVVRVPGFGKVDQPRGTVNLSVDGLQGDQVADVLLGFFLGQIQELGQTAHLDASIVFGHYTDIVLNDPLAQILPPCVGLVVSGLLCLGVEDVGVTQVRTELFSDHGPAHQLGDGEQLQQASFLGDL